MPRGGRSWSREVDLLDFAETAARAFVRLPSTVSFRAHTWPSFCFLLLCCGRSLPGLYGLGPPLASPLPIDLMRASGLVLDLALPKKKKKTDHSPDSMEHAMGYGSAGIGFNGRLTDVD